MSTDGQHIGLYSNGGGVGTDGYIAVDSAGLDIGTEGSGAAWYHGLIFGGSASGEGIGSNRNAADPNQYGIDFYTGFQKRMSVTRTDGWVGIGTTRPTTT